MIPLSESGSDNAVALVRQIADAAKALREARISGERLLLDEHHRALLSGAVLILAWVSVEEAPTRQERT